MKWGDKPYHSLDYELKQRYGGKVYKLSLTSGCSCPNRDGSISNGGCIFCSEGGSGDFASKFSTDILSQIKEAKEKVISKCGKKSAGFIAYFQSYTNTYGNADYLRDIFKAAMEPDDILGLSIGTRPDCLPDDMLKMLSELNKIKPVWVELGLQTIHEETAELINRGYKLEVFEDALSKLKDAGLEVIAHVIIGLPGENDSDIKETVNYLANGISSVNGYKARIDGIKLHLMHVMKGTELGRRYEGGTAGIYEYSLEEYTDLLIDLIEVLPGDMVIHRITGDAPKRLLLAPLWSADKKRVLNTIHKRFKERDSYQGKLFS